MKEEQKYMTPLYLDKRIFFLVQSIIMLNVPRQGFHKMCACVKLAMVQAVSEHVPNCNTIKLGARSLLLQSTSTLSVTHNSQLTSTCFLTYLSAISLSGAFYLGNNMPATQQLQHGRCHRLLLTMETKNSQNIVKTIRVLLHHRVGYHPEEARKVNA